MTQQRRYIVKKVGDHFITQMADDKPAIHCAMWTAGGGGLFGLGLMKRGLLGWLMMGGGSMLIYRGITGHSPLQRLMYMLDRAPSGRPEQSPSYQNDFKGKAGQLPADKVDEASMESFPASDPPGLRKAVTPAAPGL